MEARRANRKAAEERRAAAGDEGDAADGVAHAARERVCERAQHGCRGLGCMFGIWAERGANATDIGV